MYSYKKGQGWVPETEVTASRELTDHLGRRVRVTVKFGKPEPGEYCFKAYSPSLETELNRLPNGTIFGTGVGVIYDPDDEWLRTFVESSQVVINYVEYLE